MMVACLLAAMVLSGAADRTFDPNHLKYAAVELVDRTDGHAELAFVREQLLACNESVFTNTCAAAWFENVLTGEGKAYVRLAPLPQSRMKKGADFVVDAIRGKFQVLSNGYPCVEIPYCGGRVGRLRALQEWQRSLRPYVPGRDGLFLSNTWGDGNRDACLNEAFIRKEIDAAAELGVDVVEIDDGWQKGRSSNSFSANGKGVWNGYWAADPQFWEPDPVRFPNGIVPLAAAAKAKGLKFGLWFGPDSSNDAANWRKDADWLLHIHRDWGVDYFKIDSMKSTSSLALARQRQFFDRMIDGSKGALTFDLDVTAEVRPGYFGLPDVGTVFVENRYAADGPSNRRFRQYWPHRTLRALWSLAEVVDPVRLRMEVLNPLRRAEYYPEDDPLAPKRYRADTLFAIAMVSSPLGWFETSGISPETRAEMRPLVETWKRERTRLHTGTIVPVGSRPDGVVWTGFASVSGDGGGSVLLFRELNGSARFTLPLGPLFGRVSRVEKIAGRGAATVTKVGDLEVTVPAVHDYLWMRVVGGDGPRSCDQNKED